MIKEYLKFILKAMKSGGFVLIGVFIFSLLPFAILLLNEYYIEAILWFIISTPISASFTGFYFVDYKKKRGSN